jgi:hypothetical protein
VKSFFWLAAGVVIGFAFAHKYNQTPQGKQLFGDIDRKARNFGSAFSDGYRKREAELRAVIADADRENV